MTTRRAWAGVIALIAIYLVISLDHLDVYPIVHQDEPLFASASYKLANEGIYGTDLLAGYYGMERHVYFFMPA